MFREMRRIDRALPQEEIETLLNNGEYGFLSTVGNNGYPCIVPVSYVYLENCIYFHCATEGQKLDNIRQNDKVSFSVVGDTKILAEKFSTNYKSVVIYGRAKEVEDEYKSKLLMELIKKYSNEFYEKGMKYVENAKDKTMLIKIDIDHITGKGRL